MKMLHCAEWLALSPSVTVSANSTRPVCIEPSEGAGKLTALPYGPAGMLARGRPLNCEKLYDRTLLSGSLEAEPSSVMVAPSFT